MFMQFLSIEDLRHLHKGRVLSTIKQVMGWERMADDHEKARTEPFERRNEAFFVKKWLRWPSWREGGFVAVFAIGPLVVMEGFSRGGMGLVFEWFWKQPLLFLMNLAFFLGLSLMGCGLAGWRLRGCLGLLVTGLSALIGVINRYKMIYRMEPVLLTDIYQLGEAVKVAGGSEFDIDLVGIGLIGLITLGLMVLWAVRMGQKRRQRHLIPAVLGLALVVVLPGLCTFSMAGAELQTDMMERAKTEGTVYTLFATENYRLDKLRIDYQEEDVRNAYRALQADTPSAQAEKPNVIVVLSESWGDEAWLGQYVPLSRELTPFYNQLTQTCQTGRMYVPRIGGGTSETEFEVLTGLRSQYSCNPYSMGLPPMNSLASTLKKEGYTASAIHWFQGVYYNRYRNLRMLGFDSFFTTDTTAGDFTKISTFISDEDHYQATLERMAQTEGPDFVFVMTMQNHGGYDYNDCRQLYGADEPFEGNFSDHTRLVLSNYCYLMQQTDKALERFITALENSHEPTVLVWFSDHIPPFGTDVYGELGIPTTGDAGHLTPYFIWDSRGNQPETVNLYANELGACALSKAGQNSDPFFHYVDTLRLSRGEEPLTAAGREDEAFELLSYDALFGRQYAYDEGDIHPENPDIQLGGSLEITAFRCAALGDRLFLRPVTDGFPPKYTLYLNGREMVGSFIPLDAEDVSLTLRITGPGSRTLNEVSLHYADAKSLLSQSIPMETREQALWQSGYVQIENSPLKSYQVYRSTESYPQGRALSVMAEEQCWQKTYGYYAITGPNQYAFHEDGTLYLSIPRGSLGGDQSGDVQAWLRQADGRLILSKP